MKKLITTFALGCLVLWTSKLIAQPTFTFTPQDTSAGPGESLTFEVSVADFTNILSFQYSMNWDPAVLDYASVDNITPDLATYGPSNFGASMTPNGKLTTNWFDPDLEGVDLNDGTILYTLTFDVLSNNGTDLIFSGDPTTIEIVDSLGNEIGLIAQNAVINGGGGGGGGGDLIVSANQLNANNGDQVCLDISVENFDTILSMQYSMNFDQNVIDFVEVTNLNLQDLAPANFGTTMTNNGILTLSWFDNSNGTGVTVPDGTVIYQVCFDVIGAMGENSPFDFTGDPTTIEVFDGNNNPVNLMSNSGAVNVIGGGSGNPNGLIVSAPDLNANPGDTVCLDISVENFDSILSMQFSMNFDETIIEFIEVANLNLQDLAPANFGTTMTNNGILTISWFDNSNATGVTVPDGTVIFQACFVVVGTNGQSSPFNFTGNPTNIEVIDGNSNPVDFTGNHGSVTVGDGPPPPPPPADEFVVASDHYPLEGDTFCMQFRVNDFINIVSMQYTMAFDTNELEFVEVIIPDPSPLVGLVPNNFGSANAGEGTITFSWLDPNVEGITLADSTLIYEICFEAIGSCGTVTNVDFTNVPTVIEVIDSLENEVAFSSNPGVVDICGTPPPPPGADTLVQVLASDHMVANGEAFCMNISVNSFDEMVSMQYSMSFDTGALEFVEIMIPNPSPLPDLTAANFGTGDAGNGILTFSWDDAATTGVTLPDGTVIYQACFNVLGECGFSTNFEFTDTPVLIEATDTSGAVSFMSNPGIVECDNPPPPPPMDTSFVVASDHFPQEGEIFCMNISVNDFIEIVSMQYSMNFDPLELEFQEIVIPNPGPLPGLALSNFGTGDAANGNLTVSWFDPNVAGVTLADGTVIYQICFKVLGSCGTVTNLEFSGTPTGIEVTDNIVGEIDFTSNPGVVDICGDTPTGGITVTASDHQTQNNETFCLDVSVADFTDILVLQYSMNFDPALLEFTEIMIPNPSPLTGLTGADFGVGDASNGNLTLSWNDPNGTGVTLANNTVIYQACFNVIGECGFMTDFEFSGIPVSIDAADINGPATFTGNPGTVQCDDPPPPPPADTSLVVASDHVVQPAEEFCMDISVNNFNEIVSMQYSMNFDPAELEFVEIKIPISNPLLGLALSNFGTGDAANGNLTLSWFDPNVAGVTLADGTVIYQVCFKVLGSCGTTTNLDFSGTPTLIEVTDNIVGEIDFTSNPGVVEICEPPSDFMIIASEEEVVKGGDVCVRFSVTGFDSIASMQFTITFDPAVLQYNNFQDPIVLNDLNGFGDSQAANGIITFSWFDQTVTGINLDDNTVIFELCFTAIGNDGDMSLIDFTDDPITIEVTNIASTILNFNEDLGSVEIKDVPCDPIILATSVVDNAKCNGECTGSIDISLSGGDGTFTYEWRNVNNEIVGTGEDLTGVCAGIYSLTATSCNGQVSFMEIFQLIEPAALDLTLTINDPNCFGDNMGFIVTNPSGGTQPYFYLWSDPNQSTTPSLFSLPGGTYTLTLTDANDCQLISGPININEPPELTGTATVTQPPCADDSGTVSLSANGGTPDYEYKIDGFDYQSASTFIGIADGTYTGMIRDANNCVFEIPGIEINSPDELTLNLTGTFDNGPCDGTANAQVGGGTGPYSYQWTGPSATSDSPNQSNLCAGEYCVTVQDANGCQINDCILVSSELTIVDAEIIHACWGIDNGEIHLTVEGGVPPLTYQWNPPGPIGPSRTDLEPGNYGVTVTSMADGQTVSAIYTVDQADSSVQIGDPDIQNPTGPNNFDGFIHIPPATGGFGGPYTYKWDNPPGFMGQNNDNLDKGTYGLTVFDANDCNISASYTLIVEPLILKFLSYGKEDANCNDSDDGMFTFSVGGGLPNYNVVVTNEDTGSQVYSNQDIEPGAVITLNNLPPGNYSIHVEDLPGIYQQVLDDTFIILAPPEITIDPITIENRTDTQLGRIFITPAGGTPPYTFQWSNASTAQNPDNLQQGCYSVTVMDAKDCFRVFGNICVDHFKVDGAQITHNFCANDMNGSITPNIESNIGYTCSWTGPNNFTSGNCDLTGLLSGIYTLVVTDDNGIETPPYEFEVDAMSGTIDVTVNPTSNYNGFNVSCAGMADGSAVAIASGGIKPYDFFWSDDTPGPNLDNKQAGTYMVTVSDANGCEDEAQVTLTQPSPLTVEVMATVNPTCFGAQNGSISIQANGGVQFNPPSVYIYQWSAPGQSGPEAILLGTGIYDCTVTDRNGCQAIAQAEIEDPEEMRVNLSTTCDEGNADGTALANVFGGTGPFEFEWNTGATLQFIEGLIAGTYFVTVADSKGCMASAAGEVCSEFGCFEARTVITPEGDGKNEEFIIGCTGKFPDNKLEIFNRWGQLVYETNNYVCQDGNLDECWKGTNQRGEDLPEGVYFYIFDYTDPITIVENQKRGSVTILRQ